MTVDLVFPGPEPTDDLHYEDLSVCCKTRLRSESFYEVFLS